MEELHKIYDRWSEEQTADNPALRTAWQQILECLYENCTEMTCDKIAVKIMEYSRQIECSAFLAGYRQAFQLWMDILLTSEQE